jgi:hypothetical protein
MHKIYETYLDMWLHGKSQQGNENYEKSCHAEKYNYCNGKTNKTDLILDLS